MRARAAVRGKHATVYKAKEQVDAEGNIISLLVAHAPETPFSGAIGICIGVYLPVPASKSDWWKEAAHKDIISHTSKPDLDNYIKNILDCMSVTGFWDDDRQVVSILSHKTYSKKPRWEIVVNYDRNEPKSKKDYLVNNYLFTGENR